MAKDSWKTRKRIDYHLYCLVLSRKKKTQWSRHGSSQKRERRDLRAISPASRSPVHRRHIAQSDLSCLESHVTRFLQWCVHFKEKKSPKSDQCVATAPQACAATPPRYFSIFIMKRDGVPLYPVFSSNHCVRRCPKKHRGCQVTTEQKLAQTSSALNSTKIHFIINFFQEYYLFLCQIWSAFFYHTVRILGRNRGFLWQRKTRTERKQKERQNRDKLK